MCFQPLLSQSLVFQWVLMSSGPSVVLYTSSSFSHPLGQQGAGTGGQALDYITLMFDMEIGWEVKLDDCVKLVFLISDLGHGAKYEETEACVVIMAWEE